MENYEAKKINLKRIISGYHRPVCAYSGGVDSALLAFLCKRYNPETVAVFAEMTTLSKDDIDFALNSAQQMNLEVEILPFQPLTHPNIAENTEERCYYCKDLLFSQIKQRYPGRTLLDGSNADDEKEFRPGKRALSEHTVESPLAKAGFSKQEIRKYAAELELPAENRRSKPCLLTRFPYHINGGVNSNMLQKVESGEHILDSLFRDNFRLRWIDGNTCRIEATAEDCSVWEHTAAPEDFPFSEVLLAPTDHCSGSFDRFPEKKEHTL